MRGHWGIGNSLHWRLGVTFGEDQCRIRKGHRDENFSTLRRTALSLLKQEKTAKSGVKNKWLNAGWDDGYMEKWFALGETPCNRPGYGTLRPGYGTLRPVVWEEGSREASPYPDFRFNFYLASDLDRAITNHGIGDFDESRDVSAFDVVDRLGL